MKKVFQWMFLAMLPIVLLVTTGTCGAEKKTLAIMPLQNVSGYTEQKVAEIMGEELAKVLYQSGKYTIVERSQLANAMREIGFGMTGAVDPTQAAQAGKMAGAQYSLIGKVTMASIRANTASTIFNLFVKGMENVVDKLEGQVTVDIRLMNNETGEIVMAESVSGDKRGSDKAFVIQRACENAAEEFMEKLYEKEGGSFAHVVLVEGDTVHIDRGSESGVRKGDTLIVSKEGKPIYDLEGNIIAVNSTVVGKLKVQEANQGHSVCKITERTASGAITRGALVKRGKK